MRKTCFLAVFLLLVNGLYAQSGINNAQLNIEVKKYLEDTLKTYLNRSDLTVTDIITTTDWTNSSADPDFSYFFVEGKFRNFPIDGRILSGRLTYYLKVRQTSIRGRPGFEIRAGDQTERIVLLIDDLLSDELRDTMVINYINYHYNRPLDISIKRSRLEIFPDEINSYISIIFNRDTIIFLCAKYQLERTVLRPYDTIEIRQTQWILKRVDPIFTSPFPDYEQIRRDARNDLFAYFSDDYSRSGGSWLIEIEGTSGIKAHSITRCDLVEATDGYIKLQIEFQYDYGRLFRWFTYRVKALIFYQYNDSKNTWEYKGIEVIDRHQ